MDEVTVFLSMPEELYVDDFLSSITNQTYNKNKLHLYVDVSPLPADGKKAVMGFFDRLKPSYHSIVFNDCKIDDVQQQSVNYAISNNTHYFVADGHLILHPDTLRRLQKLGLEVVAPMLTYDGIYSNFHADVDPNGYFKTTEYYWHILSRKAKGIHSVPVVNECYLVRNDCLQYIRYRDWSGRARYVIFSDHLRRNLIPQYIDNTFNYGGGVNYRNKSDIAAKTFINNKTFFLNTKGNKKIGIICDSDWLSSFIAFEHYHVHRLLQDRYDFHIINDRHLDFTNRSLIHDLNNYDLLFLSHQRNTIPLDRIKCYKMCRIDDLVNDPDTNERAKLYFKHSNMVISPYAYVFKNYYEHENVVWVPYSCGIEGCADPAEIRFNTSPKLKILQLGNVGPSYPFRQYVAGLDDDRVEKVAHPGWNHPENTEALIRSKYYHKLNEYICCFTDSLIFRYILCKNFEIPAVGALLLTDRAIEKEMNQLGFVDFQTCIFCDRETFLDRVSWILDPENREAVDRIRRAGMDLVWAKHLTKHRAAQINELVTEALGRRGSWSAFA